MPEMPDDLERRIAGLETENRRQWKELTLMQTEVKQRLTAVETKIDSMCARLDRSGNGGPDYSPRFEQLWGVVRFAGWAVFIAILTAGTVIAALEYMA